MKYAVLVSGGVDSSVALRLLRDAGHDVTAFYIKIWLEDELSFLGTCPWQEDLSYVEAVCKQLSVPLEVVSLQREYWDRVVSYTISEAQAGRTPNPDLLCNQRIKFGAFFETIDASFQKVATGHYASTAESNGKTSLFRSPDPIKDQTYFLAYLSQQQLTRAAFPLGPYTKPEVRALADQFNLPNKERKDSQGICFLGALKFDDFLRYHLGAQTGPLVEVETGKQMGTHDGFWFYTLGQRKGIGLAGGPWYVVRKDSAENIVYISRSYHEADKQRDTFLISDCSWIGGQAPGKENLQVKIRHGAHMHECVIQDAGNGAFLVQLAQRDQGIAPGQFAVFYDDKECLGAGIISENP